MHNWRCSVPVNECKAIYYLQEREGGGGGLHTDKLNKNMFATNSSVM